MSLTELDLSLIAATIPLLETQGEVLGKNFYQIMFEDPEHTRFFNKTHVFGTGRQVGAISRAVLMYAKNINNLEPLIPLVKLIAAKHASLAILPEHYPRVGQCLLRAIKETFPDQASPELLAAWAKAYQMLADILIGVEEDIYKTNAAKEGGWRDQREFVLARKEKESEEVTSFYWTPADGKSIFPHVAGQYTSVCTTINGRPCYRNYTISQSYPMGKENEYRISVKLEKNGLMSSHLHHLEVGAKVLLTAPVGEFVLSKKSNDDDSAADTRPLVFIAGGVGITPMIPMIETALAETKRPVTLVYAARNHKVQAFRDYLDGLCDKYSERFMIHHFYSQEAHRLTLDDLRKVFPVVENVFQLSPEVYYTGPVSFMKSVKHYLKELDVPEKQCHCEFFGPAKDL
jgi:nitric oxide dioxygenase